MTSFDVKNFFIQKLFPEAPEGSSFWLYYADEHKNFQEKYQKLDVSDLFEAFNDEGN